MLPANAANKNVTWNSNNTTVATVNSTGLVTAIAVGTAVITVTTQDSGYTDNCTVTVVNAPVNFTAFTLDNGAQIALRHTVNLNYTFNGGSPTHFRVAESETALSSAAWKTYNSSALTYSFATEVHELKTVYTQLKNAVNETGIKRASILYKPLHPKLALTATLFPNPTKNYLNVVVEDITLPVQITVYSITGEVYLSQIFDTATFGIDLSYYPAGTLLVRITGGDKYVVKQIIKL